MANIRYKLKTNSYLYSYSYSYSFGSLGRGYRPLCASASSDLPAEPPCRA